MEFKFDPIEDILEEIRQGHIVIMQDAESRENEGDYICAAEFATPENVNRMASEAKGVICATSSCASRRASSRFIIGTFLLSFSKGFSCTFPPKSKNSC